VTEVGGKLYPILVELTSNGLNTTMELDTGAAVSLMSNEANAKLFPKLKPETILMILTIYTGEKLSILSNQLLI